MKEDEYIEFVEASLGNECAYTDSIIWRFDYEKATETSLCWMYLL